VYKTPSIGQLKNPLQFAGIVRTRYAAMSSKTPLADSVQMLLGECFQEIGNLNLHEFFDKEQREKRPVYADSETLSQIVGQKKAGFDEGMLYGFGCILDTRDEFAQLEALQIFDDAGLEVVRKGFLADLHSEDVTRRELDADILRRYARMKEEFQVEEPTDEQWKKAYRTFYDLMLDLKMRGDGRHTIPEGTVRRLLLFGCDVFL